MFFIFQTTMLNKVKHFSFYNIKQGDSDGATALHKSAAAGKINVVKRLCRDERLDMNTVDRYGETALHDVSSCER